MRQNTNVTKCKCDKMQISQNANETLCNYNKLQMRHNANKTKCKYDEMQMKQNANSTKCIDIIDHVYCHVGIRWIINMGGYENKTIVFHTLKQNCECLKAVYCVPYVE